MNLYPIPKEAIVVSEAPILILLFKNSNIFTWIFFILFLLGLFWLLIYVLNWIGAIIAIGLLVFYIYPWLWISMATLKLRVASDYLTIEKKLFGISRIDRIDRSDMKFFIRKINSKKSDNPRNWDLKIKINQGKLIYLLTYQSAETSEWLGRLLTDIYEVEFKSPQRRSQQ
jgi:hypothetical protein